MIKTIATLATALVLAGCQTVTKQEVSKLSTLNVCYRASMTSNPDNMTVYLTELDNRGETCHRYRDQIISMREAEARNTSQFLQGLAAGQAISNANRPPPPAFAPSMQCRSRNVYGTIYTDCN